ncbi:MAG: alpha/beta hydrolase family protein [Panacagrimonas sp.]
MILRSHVRPVWAALFFPGLVFLGLTACGGGAGSGGGTDVAPSPLPEPDGQARSSPAPGSSRAGLSYDAAIADASGGPIVFTVHEPLQLVGGQKYPLLLQGHGFGASRVNASQRNLVAPAGTPLQDTFTTKQYTDAGYGVVSFDQRGFGQTGGDISLMDPDRDGDNLVRILDWAESNLDWLAVRDGNLVVGAYGASYGGAYQLLLNNVDPRRRLDAIVPSITWNDFSYSLNSGEVPESSFAANFIIASPGRLSQEAGEVLVSGITNNRFSDTDKAYLRYRGNRYFCDGPSLPGKRAANPPPRVDALIFQGMADVLFNLNEAKANQECLAAAGGDVRLFTYAAGHTLSAGAGVPGGAAAAIDEYRCGPYVADALARLWFDAKLKREPVSIATLAQVPGTCINLDSRGEGVVVGAVPVGGSTVAVPLTGVPQLADTRMTLPLLTASGPMVVAGIPTATLNLADPAPASGASSEDAIVFVSIGVRRARMPFAGLQILGDQIRPVRGFGTQTVQLNGIGVKLAAGDQLQLVLAGQEPQQYPVMRARSPLLPTVAVSGSIQIPVLGNVATVQ